jgi:hypothetical protein
MRTLGLKIGRLTVVYGFIALIQASAYASEFPAEVPNPEALNAYRQYWSAFEAYEKTVRQEGVRRFQEAWRQLEEQRGREEQKIASEQVEALRSSAAKYRRHLKEFPDAANRPFVLLNLAQILSMIGEQTAANAGGSFAKNEALALLKEIEASHQGFVHRDDAMYLRATILESMQRSDEAQKTWQALAKNGGNSIYAVHANIAVGDLLFEQGDAAAALRSFEKAQDLLTRLEDPADPEETLRVKYRIAWAAYKSAELNKVVDAATSLLQPMAAVSSNEQRSKMQDDAVELIGDALFESGRVEWTKEVLQRREFLAFAPAIGLRTVQRYLNNGVFTEATKVAEHVIQTWPAARELPDLLTASADAWRAQKIINKSVAQLEQLALLLPVQSLWRSKHAGDHSAIRRMEERAMAAAKTAASHHYEFGMSSGSLKAFASASSFYDLLVEFAPNDNDANTWRLRIANCAFFANQLDEAARGYAELKANHKLDRATLEIASWQEVLTAEKRWRSAFEKAVIRGEEPIKDSETLAQLAGLEKSIDEFANRFPGQSRTVDLLLVGASANRDQERFDQASKFWQRALVSGPTNAQRAIAIRGLVFANMKNGSPADVIATAGKFLKLEDWKKLGLTLGSELQGVLAAATLDEGERLNKDGQVLEAGRVLVSIAREFPDIPQRDKIWRDGAYMLAIAGWWADAQSAAEDYLKTTMNRNRGDMVYLLARSHEYQIRLREAADRYFELAQKYPTHPKALTALDRAERLGVADGDWKLAGEAAALSGERLTDREARLAAMKRAVDYMEKSGNAERSAQIATKRLSASNSTLAKYESQLLLAKANFDAGREQQAIDDLEILAKRLDEERGQASRPVAAETNFLLGEEARRKFDDFGIFDRDGTLAEKVATKMQLFEELVVRYDKAASTGVPAFAPRARYRLAESAEVLADEIAGIQSRSDVSVTLKSQTRYNDSIARLREIAKKYHSNNLLAQRKDPAAYKDNEWIKRSAIKMSAFGDKSAAPALTEQMPAAVGADLPQQWSL